MLTKDLIAQMNVVARTDFNREYASFVPEFSELLYEYESGPVETVNFPFFGFLRGMELFTGKRTHQTFPDGYKFTVSNKEWDMAVDIPKKDIERAAAIGSLGALNIYQKRIAEMPRLVKDHPIELAFAMMEAGAASTYGTTFDGQYLFDTDHGYGTSAGSSSNIVTGTGVTAAYIAADILTCISRFNSFTIDQNGTGNGQKRKLNTTTNKLVIFAPTQLHGILWDLQNKDRLASGEENTLRGKFTFTSHPFSDANDWYIALLDSPEFRPFLYQIEKRPELDTPTEQDELVREQKLYTWGAYGRYNVAYGAWWTIIKVTNS